jgi:hypothetical protein
MDEQRRFRFEKMNEGHGLDKAELIKWWDVLDALVIGQFASALQRARDCRHPDAIWLVALFPPGASMKTRDKVRVLQAHHDDARALFILARLVLRPDGMVRAAHLGYVPAKVTCVERGFAPDGLAAVWLLEAAATGDRNAKARLAEWYTSEGENERAVQLWSEAAELGQRDAQYYFGSFRYSEKDWQRYKWWGCASVRGNEKAAKKLLEAAQMQLRLWEEGRRTGRVLFEIGAAYRGHVGESSRAKGVWRESDDAAARCVLLFEQWLEMARVAIRYWLMIGRRLGVAKDIDCSLRDCCGKSDPSGATCASCDFLVFAWLAASWYGPMPDAALMVPSLHRPGVLAVARVEKK